MDEICTFDRLVDKAVDATLNIFTPGALVHLGRPERQKILQGICDETYNRYFDHGSMHELLADSWPIVAHARASHQISAGVTLQDGISYFLRNHLRVRVSEDVDNTLTGAAG